MINRASFPVRFPVDRKHLSFGRRGFAEVRVDSTYFHSLATLLDHSIVNLAILALKHVVAG
jgi:hypothetical protein